MNKLFTMCSPLYIKYPNGETRVIEALFEYLKGVLYFEFFLEKDLTYSINIIKGEVMGEGPWKVGQCSLHVLGCNHTHPQLCEMHAFWQQELLQNLAQFRASDVVKIACEKGAFLPDNRPINDAR
ncbi:hypothetical protein [Abyssogena phaseoliformis symbiont]|uniref:hypothetical protein n=1 Tax=Abyssogena phaseoliformis symbiont TaxID=596095 RepID=UPI001915F515|nr:hypothetical protein [Abyssogena phaseoliformis symbiont]